MHTIGWVIDKSPIQSGRFFSIQNFKQSSPDSLEIVNIDLEHPQECDLYIVHSNTIPKNLPLLPKSLRPGSAKSKPVIVYAHQWEIWNFGATATIYQSPLHSTVHKYGKKFICPPPLVKSDYEDISHVIEGKIDPSLSNKTIEVERMPKAMWCGTASKEEGFDVAVKWTETKKVETDFFGVGIPRGNDTARSKFHGMIDHLKMPLTLQSYQKFIYFPRDPRPFDRMLAEALLAGCELEVSGRLGIESFEQPLEEVVEMCKYSTNTFWNIVGEFLP